MSRATARSAARPSEMDAKSAFAERLQLVVAHNGGTSRVARAAGLSASALRKWLAGRAEPTRHRLISLARACRVSVAWLVDGEGEAPTFQDALGAQVAAAAAGHGARHALLVIARYAIESAAAGISADEADRPRSDLAFDADWIKEYLGASATTLRTIVAVGESMKPLIDDGDLLLVDTAETSIRGFGVYVLMSGDEMVVKRVQKNVDGKIVLLNDNPLYEREELSADIAADLKIIGKVIWRGGKI